MNRLGNEKSPYLLQHADNPVDWFAWGEEAFVKARAENKPIFLSIGYSTCHWCHVMAHESFEDEATAAIMNREFVNIKVDREERPDVDRVYMTFVQATTGHGGWPMSVWLTPDLKPFVGGTYFPPEDRYGHPGFQKVLERVAGAWRNDRAALEEQGIRVLDALRESAGERQRAKLERGAVDAAFKQFSRSYDPAEGGFGSAPKFPRPSTFNFLFRYYARSSASAEGRQALEMALFTLRKMAAGGIRDHLGGGFHRYSVDRYWHVPHFEKMLYDQAQLAVAYIDACHITGDAAFAEIARDILDYVQRDMTSPDSAFYSAEDADSFFEHGKPQHGEGAFYLWTRREIESVLGGDAALFCSHYGVEEAGNVRPESDPHGEFTGRNVLYEAASLDETAKRYSLGEEEVRLRLTNSRRRLFEIREQRPRPHLDDKIITAWNGLMISAFARAAQLLQDERYAEAATGAAEFIRRELFDSATRRLHRSFREGASAISGFAEDYAFLIAGLLDLYEATFDSQWIEFAEQLQQTQDEIFWDDENGGYFSAPSDDPTILLRMKEDSDGAEPAASSIAALNLLRLAQFTGHQRYVERAEETIDGFASQLERFAIILPQMLVAFDRAAAPSQQIVIVGERDAADTKEILRATRQGFRPNGVVILKDRFFENRIPTVAAMESIAGRATAYVCEDFTCDAPVNDPRALADLLVRRGG